MRLYEFSHKLINSFVTLDTTTQQELEIESVKAYSTAVEDLRKKELMNSIIDKDNAEHAEDPDYKPLAKSSLTIKEKAVSILELWWVRYLFAGLFPFCVLWFKKFQNDVMHGRKFDDDEDEDDDDEYEEWLERKREKRRHHKTMR